MSHFISRRSDRICAYTIMQTRIRLLFLLLLCAGFATGTPCDNPVSVSDSCLSLLQYET